MPGLVKVALPPAAAQALLAVAYQALEGKDSSAYIKAMRTVAGDLDVAYRILEAAIHAKPKRPRQLPRP